MYRCYGYYNSATNKSERGGKIATNFRNMFIIALFSLRHANEYSVLDNVGLIRFVVVMVNI